MSFITPFLMITETSVNFHHKDKSKVIGHKLLLIFTLLPTITLKTNNQQELRLNKNKQSTFRNNTCKSCYYLFYTHYYV